MFLSYSCYLQCLFIYDIQYYISCEKIPTKQCIMKHFEQEFRCVTTQFFPHILISKLPFLSFLSRCPPCCKQSTVRPPLYHISKVVPPLHLWWRPLLTSILYQPISFDIQFFIYHYRFLKLTFYYDFYIMAKLLSHQ